MAVAAMGIGQHELAVTRFREATDLWLARRGAGELEGPEACPPLPEMALRALAILGQPGSAELQEAVAQARQDHRDRTPAGSYAQWHLVYEILEASSPSPDLDAEEVQTLLARLDSARVAHGFHGGRRKCPEYVLYARPVLLVHAHGVRAMAFEALHNPEQAAAERARLDRLIGLL